MSERTEAIYNSIRHNYGRMANGTRPWKNNRDEFNDVMNYAPSEYQQTYDVGTDDAGNPILGNTLSDAIVESTKPKKPGVWTGGVNAAEVSERITADEEGGELNLDELIAGGRTDLGEVLSDLHEKAKDTSLYAQYMYSAEDWAEKGKEIFDATGMNIDPFGNKDVFEKAWNLTKEVKRQQALATDANGHVDMDKVYDAMPYLRDIHEAHGTAAAVLVMNSANELKTINDIYQGEGERFAQSLKYGVMRGGLQLVNQVTGAKAMMRGAIRNEGLTAQEINDILWVTNEMRKMPQFSYSSPGSLLGGVLGSAAENAPIMLPEMARSAAAHLGKLTGPWGTAASAIVYAAMSTQIAGAQYIENLTKTDENGNPIYTPRQAAILSAAQGLAEGYLEKQSIAAASKAVFNAGTAKQLAKIYAEKDAALAAGQIAAGAARKQAVDDLTRQIIRERIQHAIKAGMISIAAESEEEFEQQVSDMVLENIAQIAIRGDQADVSTFEDILSESFGAAWQAVPATVGFGLIGAGMGARASAKEMTKQILSARERFENAQASQYARNIYENERRNNITAQVRAATPEQLEKTAPDVYGEILDRMNKDEDFVYTQVDLRTLMEDEKNKDLVDTVVKLSGATEEDVQACLRPGKSGMLNVRTSDLQRAQNITPEQQQVLNQHTAHNGKQTNYQIIEEVKRIRESLKAVEAKTDEEQKNAIENFAKVNFKDDEATQKLAREVISENPENPALVLRGRMQATDEAINEILGGHIEGLKAEGGQGTSVVEMMDQNGDIQTSRASNNPLWYQNFYADYGRAPTNADYERIAYENATGTATRYSTGEIGNLTPDDVAYFEGVKNTLDALFAERESLRKINEVLGNVRAGEFLATASLSAEAREAYNELISVLGTSGNKKVRQAARAGAIFAARMAERAAKMWRDAGENLTAKDVMPQVLERLAGKVQDQSALGQTPERDLIAYHNTTEEALTNTVDAGIAMPSLAIVRKDIPFDNFGSITLVGNSDLVNPLKGTDVYSRDAYTTRMPRPDYAQPSKKQLADFEKEWNEKLKDIPGGEDLVAKLMSDAKYYPENIEPNLKYSRELEYYYLTKIKGRDVKLMHPKPAYENKLLAMGPRDILKVLESDATPDAKRKKLKTPVLKLLALRVELLQDGIEQREKRKENGGPSSLLDKANERDKNRIEKTKKQIADIKKNGISEELYQEMQSDFDRVAEAEKNSNVIDWNRTFDNLDKESQHIIQGKEYQRFVAALDKQLRGEARVKVGRKYYPYTTENLVKAMLANRGSGQEEGVSYTTSRVAAVGSKKFRSLDEIRASKDRLVSEDEVKQIIADVDQDIYDRYEEARHYHKNLREDDYSLPDIFNEVIAKAIKGGKKATKESVKSSLRSMDFDVDKMPDQLISDIVNAANHIKDAATWYFEAKPQRAVGVGEFSAAVVPKGTSQELIQKLKDKGLTVKEYDPDVEGDRQRVTSEIQAERPDVLFQPEIEKQDESLAGENEAAEKFFVERANETDALNRVTDNMQLEDIRERLLHEENETVRNMCDLYEARLEDKSASKASKDNAYKQLLKAVEDIDDKRRAFNNDEIIESLERILRSKITIGEGSNLAKDFAGHYLERAGDYAKKNAGAVNVPGEYGRIETQTKKRRDLFAGIREDIRKQKDKARREANQNNAQAQGRSENQGGFSNAQIEDVLSQTAWHGSGAIFDHFDLGYIGTGEGAQVHGYGIYTSQGRDVAEEYRRKLAGTAPVAEPEEVYVDGKSIRELYNEIAESDDKKAFEKASALGKLYGNKWKSDEAFQKEIQEQYGKDVAKWIADIADRIEIPQRPGSLFQVEIPDDDVLLDEQKHYKEQPQKVQDSMRALLNDMSERQLKNWIRVNWGGLQGAKFTKEQLVDSILISCRHGGEFYQCLARVLKNDQRQASLLLNQYGIKGITYDGNVDGRCYVIFDDQAINIIDTYNQQVNGSNRGTYSRLKNLVSLFENADQSTFMHEMSHFYLNQLAQIAAISPPDSQAAKDYAVAKAWAEWHEGDAEAFKGTAAAAEFAKREKWILEAQQNGAAVMDDGTTKTLDQLLDEWEQEKFARGFEDYLRSGNAPSSLLQKLFRAFTKWLTQIYKDVTGVGVKPSAEVEAVMARMVATDEEIEMLATMRAAESVANVAPELLDESTAAMHARWSEEAKEEAKEKLRKEVLKEWTERDVDAHMKDFEEMEAARLQSVPAFEAELLVSEGGVSEEDAAKATGYGSVEAWKEDLKAQGGSYEAALQKSLKAERDRFTREMIHDDALIELAEEAVVSSEYAARLAALEEEAIKRRERKYKNAPKRLAAALEKMESAIDTENLYDPIKSAFRDLKYAERWNEAQQKQIEEMQETIDALTEEKQELRDMAARQSMQNAEERKEAAEKAEADKEKLKARNEKSKAKLREKLKEQLQAFKDATIQNVEWLRGVRDAVKGNEKLYRQIAQEQLDAMSAADATNWRKYMEEARKASKESARHLANAVRKQNGKSKEDTGERDFELARQAKMREALFIAEAREAAKRKKELSRIVAHLKRREKALAKDKNIDASSRYYINHLLYMMGFRTSDAIVPMTLEGFTQHMNALKDQFDAEDKGNGSIGDLDVDFETPAWLVAMVETREGMHRKIIPDKYTDYKMSEIGDLKALVDILYKTARNKNRLLTMDKSVGDAVQEIMQEYQATVTVEKGEKGLSNFYSEILQPIVMLRALGKSFVKYIYNPMFDGTEARTRMSAEAAETLNALFAKYWNKKERRAIRKKELDAELPDGTKLTKEAVLVLALNWGNDGNRLRVLNGWTKEGQYYCTEAMIEDIFRKYMTEKDWEFIQEAWDFINTFGDKVNEVMEKSTGAPMKRVEPRSFVIKAADGNFVEVKGGYYPITYDPEKSSTVSEQDLMTASKVMGGASTFGTGLGSTKARSETGLQESPLLLSIDVLFRHVNQQIHIATMRLACRDAYKILTDRSVKAMIEQSLGINAYKQLKRWVEANWNEPRMAGTTVDKFMEKLRRNTVAAIMGYRMSTALLNLANPIYMAREMGALNALSSLVNFYRNRAENRAWCLEQSPFLRNRANNIDRDLNNTAQNSFAPKNALEEVIQRTANRAIEETDMLCSLPAYYGTYKRTLNAELAKGATQEEAEKAAHYAAEDVVRRIFGSSDTLDQSTMQRDKSAMTKAFTPFYTFAATQANAVFDRYLKARYQGSTRTMKDDGSIEAVKKGIFERYGAMVEATILTYIVGSLTEQLLRELISKATGDDDKLTPEEFAKRWAAQSLSGFTSGVPGLNIAGELVGRWITGETFPTRSFGIASAATDRMIDAANVTMKFAQGKKDWIDTGRTIAKGAGAYYGFPDTITDAVFNAARAVDIDASFQEWFMKSLFDKKLKAKGR